MLSCSNPESINLNQRWELISMGMPQSRPLFFLQSAAIWMHAAAINFGWKNRQSGSLNESLQNLIASSQMAVLLVNGTCLKQKSLIERYGSSHSKSKLRASRMRNSVYSNSPLRKYSRSMVSSILAYNAGFLFFSILKYSLIAVCRETGE
jgi:hypothetical protein